MWGGGQRCGPMGQAQPRLRSGEQSTGAQVTGIAGGGHHPPPPPPLAGAPWPLSSGRAAQHKESTLPLTPSSKVSMQGGHCWRARKPQESASGRTAHRGAWHGGRAGLPPSLIGALGPAMRAECGETVAVACGGDRAGGKQSRPRVGQSSTLPDHRGGQRGERRGWAQKLGVKQAMSKTCGLPQGPGHLL